jgi:uncharacterized protein YjeT (DUF2065 family)
MEPTGGWSDLATALGLVLVIEGVLLALFPDGLRRMLTEVMTRPSQSLRVGGVVSAAIGVAIVWLVRG